MIDSKRLILGDDGEIRIDNDNSKIALQRLSAYVPYAAIGLGIGAGSYVLIRLFSAPFLTCVYLLLIWMIALQFDHRIIGTRDPYRLATSREKLRKDLFTDGQQKRKIIKSSQLPLPPIGSKPNWADLFFMEKSHRVILSIGGNLAKVRSYLGEHGPVELLQEILPYMILLILIWFPLCFHFTRGFFDAIRAGFPTNGLWHLAVGLFFQVVAFGGLLLPANFYHTVQRKYAAQMQLADEGQLLIGQIIDAENSRVGRLGYPYQVTFRFFTPDGQEIIGREFNASRRFHGTPDRGKLVAVLYVDDTFYKLL